MANFNFSVKETLTVIREHRRDPIVYISAGLLFFSLVLLAANQAWDLVDRVSAVRETPKLPDSVSPVAQPKLVKLKEQYLIWQGKTWVHSIVLKVVSPIQTGPVYVEMRADGIQSMIVSGDDKQTFLISDERNEPGIRRIRIQNPSGIFRVRTVTERGTKINFDYGFE